MQNLFSFGVNKLSKNAGIRLYVETPLAVGGEVLFNEEQSRYLAAVMRLAPGDAVLLFDGVSGEFSAEIVSLGKKAASAVVRARTRPFAPAADVWLLFAPVKKDRTDFVIEKATELGAGKIVPVITRHTITDRVRLERLRAQAAEAAEQSRRLEVPEIGAAVRLEKLLAGWDPARRLFFMDESGGGRPAAEAFGEYKGPAALLVGPEGGFAEEELSLLRSLPFARAVSLGPLILRAETAAAAALSVWQATSGLWNGEENEKEGE